MLVEEEHDESRPQHMPHVISSQWSHGVDRSGQDMPGNIRGKRKEEIVIVFKLPPLPRSRAAHGRRKER